MLHHVSWRSLASASLALAVFLTGTAAGVGLSYLSDQMLVIQEIRIRYGADPFPLYGLDGLGDASMITMQEDEIADRIRRQNPHLDTLLVEKTFPSTITLVVSQHQPVAAIESTEGWIVIGTGGIVLEKHRDDQDPPFPLINYYQKIPHQAIQTGDLLDYHDISVALAGMEILRSMEIITDRVTIETFETVDLLTTDAQTVTLSSEKSIESQQHQLEHVIGALRRQDSSFASLDLRFDRPILVPNP